MSFKPRNFDSPQNSRRRNRSRKKLIVTGDFTMPEKFLGWEVELLAPIVGPLIAAIIEEHDAGELSDE